MCGEPVGRTAGPPALPELQKTTRPAEPAETSGPSQSSQEYIAPGEISRPASRPEKRGLSLVEERKRLGLILVAVLLSVVVAIGGIVYWRTRERPLNTVQQFWFWANHSNLEEVFACWTPEYLARHPEIEQQVLGAFDKPTNEGNFIGTRVCTNSYQDLMYDIQQTGPIALAITYAPGEVTGNARTTKAKLSEMILIKQGGKWYITTLKLFW